MPHVQVALIGYGVAGEVFHAPLIEATPGLELAGIATADPARAGRARSRFPQATIHPDLAAIVQAAERFDVAVVATPNALHVEAARRLIEAGLHVVVDKPVAPTQREVVELEVAARERGVTIVPFHNRRWDGDFQTVRRLLAAGVLGKLFRFESRFEVLSPADPQDRLWRFDAEPGRAGGILYDLGTHLVDQAIELFGTPRSVYCEQRRRYRSTDDDTFVSLGYESGLDVHLWMSIVAVRSGPRFRVLGAEAAFVKHGLDPQEAAAKAGGRPGDATWGQEPADMYGTLFGAAGAVERVPTVPGDATPFYRALRDHLRGESPAPVEISSAATVAGILEAAAHSAQTGSVVDVTDGTIS